MSDVIAELDAALKQHEVGLSARDSATFALETATLANMTREADIRENDLQTYPERCRQQRHHDVLCLVLKELVRDDRARQLDMIPGPTVEAARKFADLAYPPPKAEP